MKAKEIIVVDLFCGAGGSTIGIVEAAEERGLQVRGLAINHSQIAIETHSANHPKLKHLCANLETVNPREFLKSKRPRVHVLWASPECTHFSYARGGKPINDQSRATAYCVLRWIEVCQPEFIFVENVPEFRSWGPLGRDGKVIRSRKGRLFLAWLQLIRELGYRVEFRVLCAANFGDPTTRRRLFIYCARGRRKIIWPEATHAEAPAEDMLRQPLKPWRTAREIIDWDDLGQSIFERKKPLAEKTMRRIAIGLNRFGLGPFIVPQHRGGQDVKSVDQPVPTLTTQSRGVGLAQPFLVELRGTSTAHSIDKPVPAVTGSGAHAALVSPYLVQISHGNGQDQNGDQRRVRSVDEPVSTVVGKGEWALCSPFILPREGVHGGNAPRSIDEPVPTVTPANGHALCTPFVVRFNGEREGQAARIHSIDEPMPTLDTSPRYALVSSFLVKYFGTGQPSSIDKPAPALTTNDRLGLANALFEIDGKHYLLDIRFRMFKPGELALAQGFPAAYRFKGNKTQIVWQIGNAVPRHLGKALSQTAIAQL